MRLVPEDNGVVVTAEKVEAIFISESSRIRRGFITLSGHCESTSHNMSINNELIWSSIPAADFNTTGRRLMGISARYAVVRVDREEIDFKFEGNLLADIANIFHDSVLPIVMSEVEEALAININHNLPVSVNALFRMDDAYLQLFPANGTMPKYEDFRIDFQVNNNPQVTEKYIGFSVKALWFNIIQGYRELPVDRAEPLPMWTDKYDQPLQIMANKYFWDGFCRTYIESNPGWGFNLTQASLGPKSPIGLDTYRLNTWFPGIADYYAAYNDPATKSGLPIRAFFEFLNITGWDSWEETDQMGAYFDLVLHFNVTMPNGEDQATMKLLFENYQWNMSMVVDNYIFHVALQNGHAENVRILYCNFCTEEYPLDPVLYREVFNTVLSPKSGVIQTFFNPVLNRIPIKWPPEIMNIG
jgi:hypothetical protein